MLATLALITILTLAANAAVLIYFARKVTQFMSDAAFQKLTADVETLTAEKAALKADALAKDAKILDLEAQLTAALAAAGTPDADVLALDAKVEAALDTAAPAPPAPETPPAA